MADTLLNLSNEMAATVTAASAGVARVEGRRRLPASGIVWSPDGVIVTAHHVVEHSENIMVGLADGQAAPATLVGRDPTTDLAVLRAQATGLTPLAWAEPDTLQVGHLVLALGRPGRNVMATLGIVSASAGSWRTSMGGSVDHYLQADATMYPGFSGGPLVDAVGRAVGLNTTSLLRGAGITIPAPTVRTVVETLLAHGRVQRGYLGVGTQPARLPAALAAQTGQETALLVVSVEPGGPADTAGLLLGDSIVSLGGQSVSNLDDLLARLGSDQVGEAVPVRLVRGGQVQELVVTIGERP